MKEIYVQVKSETINSGITTFNASGGITPGNYYIAWTSTGGFTGEGWSGAWDSPNVPLKEAWSSKPATGYDATYIGFIKYVEESRTDDLSEWLDDAGWTNDQKYAFARNEYPDIWMNCTLPG